MKRKIKTYFVLTNRLSVYLGEILNELWKYIVVFLLNVCLKIPLFGVEKRRKFGTKKFKLSYQLRLGWRGFNDRLRAEDAAGDAARQAIIHFARLGTDLSEIEPDSLLRMRPRPVGSDPGAASWVAGRLANKLPFTPDTIIVDLKNYLALNRVVLNFKTEKMVVLTTAPVVLAVDNVAIVALDAFNIPEEITTQYDIVRSLIKGLMPQRLVIVDPEAGIEELFRWNALFDKIGSIDIVLTDLSYVDWLTSAPNESAFYQIWILRENATEKAWKNNKLNQARFF